MRFSMSSAERRLRFATLERLRRVTREAAGAVSLSFCNAWPSTGYLAGEVALAAATLRVARIIPFVSYPMTTLARDKSSDS
jgi:hypothetical protein